jgi:pyruvate dehydrogenase E2 component (dihydrolipoamide acetyltransferase)
MPIEITMPKLTDTMTDATLAKWLKREGDKVKPGDMIAEVETDKATQELEAFEAGTLAKIVVPEGGKTAVGALICVIAKPGEDAKAVAASVKSNGAAKPAPKAGGGDKAEAPTQPRQESADDSKAPVGQHAGLPEKAHPVQDVDEGHEPEALHTGKIRVSPLARKIADEKGVDLSTVRGTGPDGRIIKRDVLEAAGRPPAQSRVTSTPVAATGPNTTTAAPVNAAKLESKRVPLTNMRQTIAKRLQLSKQTIPHFYVSIDVLMDNLLALRAQANEQLKPEKLTVTDFIARAVAVAITRVPEINASFTDTEIVQHGSVDLGIAVSLENGLVVPVVRGAHAKGVRQISQEIKQLAADAKAGRLKINQMTGSTFSISNMGMYGIKDFQAIINPPEAAILAVGGTEQKPVVKNGQVVPGNVMTLTLSCDHRVVDGAMGARFLAELKAILENPLAMLI